MTIVWFILGLSFLIFIHELGHFTFAKIFNVYVYEFSLFMGPKIFQIKGKETKYTLRCLPIGGYCSMAGEQDQQSERNEKEIAEENEKQEDKLPDVPFNRTIAGVSWIKKFLILLAGPAFNLILCFLLLVVYFAGVGEADLSSKISVVDNSIFASAGLESNDVITGISATLSDGTTAADYEISTWEEIQKVLQATNPKVTDNNPLGKTQCLDITYTRDGVSNTVNNVCRTFTTYTVKDGTVTEIQPIFGFSRTNKPMSFGNIIKEAGSLEVQMGVLIFQALGDLFKPGGLDNVSGPVGMYESAVVFANQGFFAFLFYLAMISVNLGIINLLPLPALDGGRLLFMIIEKIIRRKINPKVEGIINTVGFILLFGFIILITVKDIFF
ncbi:MAG: M50 family metallopeptidase [Bacilli bacterium]|nr:M50 family metallopeptidase [Bacilli bacterium]MDD3422277.1 M50 family metallopeptidase [Bacilli bacterium]MDD4065908.1 M50 family metallopeptidase [Bacilli bacterium]